MNKLKKKLSSESGETILETLVALLIIVFSITFLTTAITKSDKILGDVKNVTEEGFSYNKENASKVTVSAEPAGIMNSRTVTRYKVEQFDGAGEYYYYYEP